MHERKVRKAHAKFNPELAARLRQLTPTYRLDHLVRGLRGGAGSSLGMAVRYALPAQCWGQTKEGGARTAHVQGACIVWLMSTLHQVHRN